LGVIGPLSRRASCARGDAAAVFSHLSLISAAINLDRQLDERA